MKVLLDECLPRRLKSFLAPHEVQTVPDMGWAGKKNGELLSLLAGKFEAFLTILEARECTNCPFDPNPEYLVLVNPEPPQFSGKPSYLKATSLTRESLRCGRGKDAVYESSVQRPAMRRCHDEDPARNRRGP